MLSESQCIEVADKVWRWKKRDASFGLPEESRPLYWYEPSEKEGQLVPTFSGYQLKDEVNSWSGFGRTLEAMAGQGWFFQEVTFYRLIHLGFVSDSAEKVCIEWDPESPKELITATHLGALEALKNESNRNA